MPLNITSFHLRVGLAVTTDSGRLNSRKNYEIMTVGLYSVSRTPLPFHNA